MQDRVPFAGLVLAAGRGTRMRTDLPKALVPVGGRPMLLHLIDTLAGAGVSDITVVVGYDADRVRAVLPLGVAAVSQPEPRGTAHAVAVAGPFLRSRAAPPRHLFVTVGDSPLLQARTVRRLVRAHLASGAACTFLTGVFDEPKPYARVLRDRAGHVRGCVEEGDATIGQRRVREMLTSHFAFDAEALWSVVDHVAPRPRTGERYLTDVVSMLIVLGRKVRAVRVADPRELVGLNTPEDVAWAEGILAERSGIRD